MKKKILEITVLYVLVLLVAPTVVVGQTVEERMETLEKRVEQLEGLLEQAGVEIPDAVADTDEEMEIEDRIGISGVIEVEGAYVSEKLTGGGRNRNSDIVLATVELGIEAEINDRVAGNVVLLWEEDDTEPVDLDVGTITWAGKKFDITAGRFYMPLGTFNSHFISDPLTLELGETSESGVLATLYPSERITASVVVANGDVDKTTSNDNVNDFGLRLDFKTVMNDDTSLDVGMQYYSDISDTDGEILGSTGNVLVRNVGALGLSIDLEKDGWSVNTEYIGAARSFDPSNLDSDTDGQGDKPAAWNFEIARSVHEKCELALKYEGSSEFADFPGDQYGIAGSWNIADDTTFSSEYLYGAFDSDFSTSGTDYRHSLTTQLAIEF